VSRGLQSALAMLVTMGPMLLAMAIREFHDPDPFVMVGLFISAWWFAFTGGIAWKEAFVDSEK